MEMPCAAPSMILSAITDPEYANSEKIATSPEPMQTLPRIWQFLPVLMRTALKAQSLMRLSATITSSAR